MNLDQIKKGQKIFIDSNIFIYHFTGVSEQCSIFLEFCERKEYKPFTGVNVLLEVLHRLMTIEAVQKNMVKPPNVVKKLQNNKDVVINLDQYFTDAKIIEDINVSILPLNWQIVKKSHYYRKKYGMLVNDSIILSMMKDEKIFNIATNDKDFCNVQEIKIFTPSDIHL